MVEHQLRPAPPAAPARPDPHRRARRTGRSRTAVLRIGAGVTYARIDRRARRAAARAWRWPRARSARRRSATAARSAATSARRPRPATRTRRCWPPAPRSRWRRCAAARLVAVADFFTGVKRNALAPDELIAAVHVPVAGGPQQFAKVGTRNAMVIAVCSFALALHPDARRVGTGIGSAAPHPARAPAAEQHLAGELDWEGRAPLDRVRRTPVRRARRRGRRPDRRRPRQRGLPPARAGRAGAAAP